jgi:hypothetical protein
MIPKSARRGPTRPVRGTGIRIAKIPPRPVTGRTPPQTPLIYSHVNPYGVFRLDMSVRLPIEPTEALAA